MTRSAMLYILLQELRLLGRSLDTDLHLKSVQLPAGQPMAALQAMCCSAPRLPLSTDLFTAGSALLSPTLISRAMLSDFTATRSSARPRTTHSCQRACCSRRTHATRHWSSSSLCSRPPAVQTVSGLAGKQAHAQLQQRCSSVQHMQPMIKWSGAWTALGLRHMLKPDAVP